MGASMTSHFATRCPLCGSPVLSLEHSGRVLAFEMHTVRLAGDFGRGYTLCDDCGLLADIPIGLTRN
jgi:hypothetical protein